MAASEISCIDNIGDANGGGQRTAIALSLRFPNDDLVSLFRRFWV